MRTWIQITCGRGPAECAWVVPRTLSRLLNEAAVAKLRAEVLETVPGRYLNTLYSALLAVEGEAASDFIAHWTGTVQWIGQSPLRPNHKRKNWFIGVSALAVPQKLRWSERDLKFETLRASGPGGQNVNKVESAVRVTHTPTGISVLAREERSQLANRKLALARLAEEMDSRQRDVDASAERDRWSQHNNIERGNPVRVFEGPGFVPRS